jgi:hypothetical protein
MVTKLHDGRAAGRRQLTRRQLIVAFGAAALAGCGTQRLAPVPLAVPRARRAYLRGVNCYTLYYGGGAGEPASSYEFLAARGHRLVRLPFAWGRIQPRLGGALDAGFLGDLRREVARIGQAGMRTVLDIHSGGRHPGTAAGDARLGAGISGAQFAGVWLRISEHFGGDGRVYAYDLMNEPFGMPDAVWEQFSQAAVDALRTRGDGTLLWIEGNGYALPGTWTQHHPRPWIQDPLERHAYSAHCYPGDAGSEPQVMPSLDDERAFLSDLRVFLDWLHRHGRRGSIGEVGWPSRRRVGASGARAWNSLGEAWYGMADAAGVDVTYFGASSAYDNWLWAYDAARNALPAPGLTRAESQAPVLEAHPSRCPPGAAATPSRAAGRRCATNQAGR